MTHLAVPPSVRLAPGWHRVPQVGHPRLRLAERALHTMPMPAVCTVFQELSFVSLLKASEKRSLTSGRFPKPVSVVNWSLKVRKHPLRRLMPSSSNLWRRQRGPPGPVGNATANLAQFAVESHRGVSHLSHCAGPEFLSGTRGARPVDHIRQDANLSPRCLLPSALNQ